MQESVSPCYDMRHRFRGHAVIICNENFERDANRLGAAQDLFKMTALFKALDFHVSSYLDLKADEMMTVIKKASQSDCNMESDCFVLVLSSHGHEIEAQKSGLQAYYPDDATVWRHAVLGCDSNDIYVDKVLELFDDKVNKQNSLRGKPKLFFIQACQSGHLRVRKGNLAADDFGTFVELTDISNVQASQEVEDTFINKVKGQRECDVHIGWRQETDGWLPGRRSVLEFRQGPVPIEGQAQKDPNTRSPRSVGPSSYDIIPLNCPEDCLVMYPSMIGMFAYRDRVIGSYMLHYMCQPNIRNILLHGQDILQYSTRVNSEMAKTNISLSKDDLQDYTDEEKEYVKKQGPVKFTSCMIHKLTKSLKFIPKKPDSVMAKMRELST